MVAERSHVTVAAARILVMVDSRTSWPAPRQSASSSPRAEWRYGVNRRESVAGSFPGGGNFSVGVGEQSPPLHRSERPPSAWCRASAVGVEALERVPEGDQVRFLRDLRFDHRPRVRALDAAAALTGAVHDDDECGTSIGDLYACGLIAARIEPGWSRLGTGCPGHDP